MKKSLLFHTIALFAGLALAQNSADRETIVKAAKNLADQENYAWKTTTKVPDGSRYRPGPVTGKTGKNGLTHVTRSYANNTSEVVVQGEKAAVTDSDGNWRSAAELENAEGRERFLAYFARNTRTPAQEAIELAGFTKDLTKEGTLYSGKLSDEGVRAFISFRRRGGGGPEVRDPEGSVKYWVKDDLLQKLEYHVKGTMSFNSQDIELDRLVTTEIMGVGTTEVEVPEAAKGKLKD